MENEKDLNHKEETPAETLQNSNRSGPFAHAFATFIVKKRNILFPLMVAIILGMLGFAKNIFIDNSIQVWFLDDDPTLLAYEEFKKIYGNDEVIIAVIEAPGGNVFTPDFLNRLRTASLEIEENEDIRRVLSIGKAPYIGLEGTDTIVVEDLIQDTLETAAQAEVIRERFKTNRLWPKLLMDKESRRTILIAEPVATHEMDQKRSSIISSVSQKLQKQGFKFKLAGMGVMYDELNRLSIRDSSIFTTLSYIVLLLTVFILFRSPQLTGILFVAMVLAVCLFLGVFGYFGQAFNMVTIVLPTLMMILAMSDIIHIFNHYCLYIDDIIEDREKGLIKVFSTVFAPCLFTSITDALGFASIVVSRIAVLRVFGAFASFVAMAEFFIGFITSAFFLGLITPSKTIKMNRPFSTLSVKIAKTATGYATLVIIIFTVTTGLSFYGLSILDVDTYSMGFLKESNEVRQNSDYIESVYGYYLPLELRFITGKTDGILRKDFLEKLLACQNAIEELPEAEKAASITDVICRLNELWATGPPGTLYRIPDTDLQIEQLVKLFYASDPDNDLVYMTDSNYSEARVTVRIPMVSAQKMKSIKEKISSLIQRYFPPESGVNVVYGGYVPLYIQLLSYITWSQITSFSTAICVIFFVIGLLFMRISSLIMAIIPNMVPIFFTLGFMGIANIRLDIATVTIAAITLGIAVDDTIHALFHYYRWLSTGLNPKEAIEKTMSDEGSAIIITSVIIIAGFSILAFASIKSVIYFGLLIALSMFFALIGDIYLLPGVIAFLYSRHGTLTPGRDENVSI